MKIIREQVVVVITIVLSIVLSRVNNLRGAMRNIMVSLWPWILIIHGACIIVSVVSASLAFVSPPLLLSRSSSAASLLHLGTTESH